MKNKIVYYSLLSIFSVAIITIVVLCASFLLSPSPNNSPNDPQGDKPAYTFSYGDNISLLFGDEFNLSPAEDSSLFYAPMQLGIVNITESGLLTTQKCGTVTVKIWDGEELIKTINFSISIKCTFQDVNNCEATDNSLTLTNSTCYFNLALLNSKNEIVQFSKKPTLTASDGITTAFRFGTIELTAANDGTLTICYDSIDARCEINVFAP